MFLLVAVFVFAVVAMVLAVWPPRLFVYAFDARHPEVIFRGPGESRRVAITIDDGPHPTTTPAILQTLARHDVRATFFLLGSRAREHPDLVQRIRDGGHEIGNHMMFDRPSVLLPREEFMESLLAAEEILELSESDRWFRPGSGWFRGWMLEAIAARGYRLVLGSAYVQDTKLRHAGVITWLLRQRTRAQDIVILHEGSASRTWTPRVLDQLIPLWRKAGLTVGSVGELLSDPGPEAPPQHDMMEDGAPPVD